MPLSRQINTQRNAQIDRILENFLKDNRPRAGSLIITLFGDVISQHGNCVWLGSIIENLELFGLNARQIRTAVGRLVQENWLQFQQVGRKSFYSFSDVGERQFQRAARRIYLHDLPNWDGNWTLVLLTQLAPILRDRLRRELGWLGFGQINSNSLAHPSVDKTALTELISALGVEKNLMILQAVTDELTGQKTVEDISYQSWNLAEIKPRYELFCQVFQSALAAIEGTDELNARQMFELRLLMIHEYRRLLLKTTELPSELLPKEWPGSKALSIAKSLYSATSNASLSFIEGNLQTIDGQLPPVGKAFYERFV